jgi:hypothetical protein
VLSFLSGYYTNNGNVGAVSNARGGSTLALPIAVADLMIFNLALVVAMYVQRRGPRPLLIAAGTVLLLGAVAAGEFSGIVGLFLGIVAVSIGLRSTLPLRHLGGGALAAALLLWPVISARLSGFNSSTGLPVSWTGRLYNLENIFWPQLFDGRAFLLGVRPAARVPTGSKANGFIWIESGYTWLLWAGGVPLLAAFLYFLAVAGRTALVAARDADPSRAVAGLSAFSAVVVVSVLMIIDPHVTYRGSGDLLFVLLGICAAPAAKRMKVPS